MIETYKRMTDKCVEGQMKIFDQLNIHFDVFNPESDYVYNKYLQSILEKLDKKVTNILKKYNRCIQKKL